MLTVQTCWCFPQSNGPLIEHNKACHKHCIHGESWEAKLAQRQCVSLLWLCSYALAASQICWTQQALWIGPSSDLHLHLTKRVPMETSMEINQKSRKLHWVLLRWHCFHVVDWLLIRLESRHGNAVIDSLDESSSSQSTNWNLLEWEDLLM